MLGPINSPANISVLLTISSLGSHSDVSKLLNDEGFEAEMDCYEADDGDGDYGRPIMIQFWSVKLPGIKLKKSIEI